MALCCEGRPIPHLLVFLILVTLCDTSPFHKRKACGLPNPPPHTTYRCQPPLCEDPLRSGTFKLGTVVEYYCQQGYILSSLPAISICLGGQWNVVRDVVCKSQGDSVPSPTRSFLAATFVPVISAATVIISALLLMGVVCALAKPDYCICRCPLRAYEALEESSISTAEHVEEPDLNQSESNGVLLPSYEEAVSDRTGPPLLLPPPPAGLGSTLPAIAEGFVSLSELLGPPHTTGSRASERATPPPSYQEVMMGVTATLAGAEAIPEEETPTEQPSCHVPAKESQTQQ